MAAMQNAIHFIGQIPQMGPPGLDDVEIRQLNYQPLRGSANTKKNNASVTHSTNAGVSTASTPNNSKAATNDAAQIDQ